MKEFYKKYRPKSLKGVIGQDSAIASLKSLVDSKKIPHFILLSGPSGVGKTTIARILKGLLGCDEADFIEKNCADFKGIDTVREIRKHINLRPMAGDCRIHLIDEAHKLTPDAQEALLKMLEDTPAHAYFILATTDPGKLKKAIHTRATEIVLNELAKRDLCRCMDLVVKSERIKVDTKVIHAIADRAEGSPRKALVLLEQVCGLEDAPAMINAIQATTFSKDAAIDLCRELMSPDPSWENACGILRSIQDQDAEGIRYAMLGYANSCLIGKRQAKAAKGKYAAKCFKVIEIFSEPFYNSKMAGLAGACYEVIHV